MIAVATLALWLSTAIAPLPAEASEHSSRVAGSRVPYDRGVQTTVQGAPGSVPVPLFVPFLSDCGAGESPPTCGSPPAIWPPGGNPVEVCTHQLNRPAVFSAQRFRDAVAAAARTWNEQEAAVGLRYVGDCDSGFRSEDGNSSNEIGWDDFRALVSGAEVAVTRVTQAWSPSFSPTTRLVREADIVLDPENIAAVPSCLESVVAHEFGHVLNLGHSDQPADLMFESFDLADLSTCTMQPSADERARLQELYGVDRNPTVSAGANRTVDRGAPATLRASGSDPERRGLTYVWEQISGRPVELKAKGADVTFIAPDIEGTVLALQVTVFDHFLHRASASVAVTVGTAPHAPALAPSLASFLPAGNGNARLTWSGVSGASSYEFCSRPAGDPVAQCEPLAVPFIDITWDTVLEAAGAATDYRLFTTGARETTLRACNSQGCSISGTGGLSGGLRWSQWDIDFDYFALAFDFGRVQFTIVGVVNLSHKPRLFTVATGPASDPDRIRLRDCGLLPSGAVCIGFLGPGPEHFAVVSVTSRRAGEPTTEHRITIRPGASDEAEGGGGSGG